MGTTSATRRQSHALGAIQALGQRQLLATLRSLGKGDQVRGAFLTAAVFLAAAGCLLPHLQTEIVAAVLFVASAIAALIAFTALDTPAATQSPSSEPRQTAHLARPLPRTLQDLSLSKDAGAGCDLAHWHRLTHCMSHELRTPLNAVLGFSELMASEAFGPLGSPQYLDYAASINMSGRVLLKSAEDALAITSLLTGLSTRVRNPVASVRNAMGDMLAFHGPQVTRSGLDLSANMDTDCQIVGEPQTLRQILINLMSEGLDHASAGAHLSFDCAHSADEVSLTVSLEGPGAAMAGRDTSFSLMLARTLVQLSQARMTEETGTTRWSATVVFQRAVQRDFFSEAA